MGDWLDSQRKRYLNRDVDIYLQLPIDNESGNKGYRQHHRLSYAAPGVSMEARKDE